MNTLKRVHQVRTFVGFVNVSLDVANYVAGNAIGRALRNYIDSHPDTEPARIQVKSERGRPVR